MAVNFNFTTPYTAPTGNALSFSFSATVTEQFEVRPAGIEHTNLLLGYPTVTVVKFARTLAPPSIAAGIVGAQTGTVYSKFNFGDAVPYVRGDLTIFQFSGAGGTRHLYPYGFTAGNFGTNAIAPSPYVYAAGFDASRYGAATIQDRANLLRTLYPSGLDAGSFGTTVSGRSLTLKFGLPGYTAPNGNGVLYDFVEQGGTKGIYVAGSDHSAFGTPTIEYKTKYLIVSGIFSGDLGALTIYNNARIVAPVGFSAGSFGTQAIDNANRYAYPNGYVATLFGTTLVAGSIRNIYPPSLVATSYGTPFVADAMRFLSPSGTLQVTFGTATVATTLLIAPAGYGGEQIGQANVHDNKQTVYEQGKNHLLFGDAYLSRSPRVLSPLGIPDPALDYTSLARVYNLRQIVKQIFEVTPYDGGTFGTFSYVENRNRIMGAIGFKASVFGNALIDNGARLLEAAGLDETVYGDALVAYRIRTVLPDGFAGVAPTSYQIIYNAAREIAPTGIAQYSFGLPSVVSNLQTLKDVGRIEGEFGTAFIADRVRTLAHYYPYESDPPPEPLITLGSRHIDLNTRGIAPNQIGHVTLEIHFNIFYPHGFKLDAYGIEHHVYNLTPELHINGFDQAEYGHATVFNYDTHVAAQGDNTTLFGLHAIGPRTKTVVVPGINAFRKTEHDDIRLNQPDLPSTQYIDPAGFWTGADAFGSINIHGNVLFPQGYTMSLYGQATVYANSIFPSSFFSTDPTERFGIPTLPSTQVIDLVKNGLAAGSFPKQRLDPHTIWCTTDTPQQAIDNHPESRPWALMDGQFVDAKFDANPSRPFFGIPRIDNRQRAIQAKGENSSLIFGALEISLFHRTIPLDGMKLFKPGYPTLWGGESSVEVRSDDDDYLVFGSPDVAFYEDPLIPRTLLPSGFTEQMYSSPIVQNFNREVLPAGIDGTIGIPRVHPPEPLVPTGYVATLFGSTLIDFKNRVLLPQGFDQLAMDSEARYFTDKMTVTQNDRVNPPTLGDGLSFGTTYIGNRVRPLNAKGFQSDRHGTTVVTRYNQIALGGYGLDAGAFGDVDRWEAGKIKAHGDDMLNVSVPHTAMIVAATGFDAAVIGSSVVGPVAQTIGFDDSIFGDHTLTHSDNAHVCGTNARGIPVAGFNESTVGSHSIA
jgi:hypothetical protein